MEFVCSLIFLLVVGLVQGNENSRFLGESEDDKSSGGDQEAYESFASPVYGPRGNAKSGGLPPPTPKSGYPLPPVPAGYSGYLASLGYGYGLNPYNRYGVLPQTSGYYGYGSPYNSLTYGYGPGLNSLYNAGLAYANPAFGRDYSIYGNTLPGYAGLGFRFGGLGYNSAYFRAPGVPAVLPSTYGAVPPSVPAPYTNGVLPIPPTYGGIPAQVGSAPAPVPVPSPAVSGRPPVVTTQGKDGSLRYAYAPYATQRLPAY